MPAYLFDSHALLAFFQGEPGADRVDEILRDSRERPFDVFICMMNFGEIVYLTRRRFGDEKKIEVVSRIYQLGLTVLRCGIRMAQGTRAVAQQAGMRRQA